MSAAPLTDRLPDFATTFAYDASFKKRLFNLSTYASSEPFGKAHSSSSSAMIPRRPSSSEICSLFSGKAIAPHEMPSATYSARWVATRAEMNWLCNFSLAKLMHSCSSELTAKFSKPKMSSRPMKRSSALAELALAARAEAAAAACPSSALFRDESTGGTPVGWLSIVAIRSLSPSTAQSKKRL